MIELLGCLLSVGAVAFATAIAGRLVGISLVVVSSGLMAFLMPPVFSLRVESSAGIAALVVNGLTGLFVAHVLHPRRGSSRVAEPVQERSQRPPAADRPLLAESVLQVIERDQELRSRASDVCVDVDQNSRPSMAAGELEWILLDILRIAFSHSNVHRVGVYFSRRPEEECVRIVAEYAVQATLPRLRMTGRADEACAAIALSRCPDGCSATWFDNGFEFIYQVRINRRLSA
jgi:hypothetical protein